MSDAQAYLAVTAVLFIVVALIHLLRAISGWDFIIGPYALPIAVSWVGFVVTGGLAAWSIVLMRRTRPTH